MLLGILGTNDGVRRLYGTQRRRAEGFLFMKKGILVSGAKLSAIGTRGTDEAFCEGLEGPAESVDRVRSTVELEVGQGKVSGRTAGPSSGAACCRAESAGGTPFSCCSLSQAAA